MEKINIAELLKDCPTGMELDCTMYDSVEFNYVLEGNAYPIKIETPDGKVSLNKYGCYSNNKHAKCIIFPKGKTTWEGFVPPCKFKDGDVLTYMYCNKPTIYIYRENGCCNTSYYAGYSFANESFYKGNRGGLSGDRTDLRLATEEEKQKLFQFIKDYGYKWNAETKTLEKLVEPKFKVEDRIRPKSGYSPTGVIIGIDANCYQLENLTYVLIVEQDKWELAPNKFDINTLTPFESRILVRNTEEDIWKPAIFGCYMKDKSAPYYALGGICWRYCIPYEGNEHLPGTTDDCDDFYKI